MRRLWRILLVLCALIVLLLLGVAGVLRSEWLRETIRAKIVSETERATGGKARLGRFDYDWRTLTVTAHDFTHSRPGG